MIWLKIQDMGEIHLEIPSNGPNLACKLSKFSPQTHNI